LRQFLNSTDPIPAKFDDTSFGMAQMNLSVVIELIDKGYLDRPAG